MSIEQSRRRFVSQLGIAGVAAIGGLAGAGLGGGAETLAAEPPPEITTIRFGKDLASHPATERRSMPAAWPAIPAPFLG